MQPSIRNWLDDPMSPLLDYEATREWRLHVTEEQQGFVRLVVPFPVDAARQGHIKGDFGQFLLGLHSTTSRGTHVILHVTAVRRLCSDSV